MSNTTKEILTVRTDKVSPSKEKTARVIAAGLIFIVLLVITFQFSVTLLVEDEQKYSRLSDVFNVVFPVITGFLGSAISYYFVDSKNEPS